MKILIFSELLYPHGGGAELATWLYAKMLAEKGFDLSIVTSKFPNEQSFEIINDRIKVYRFPMRAFFGTRYHTLANIGTLMSNLMTKLIKRSDIVYIPGGWYSAIPIAKAHRKPIVVHLHNYSIACPTSLMYDFARQSVGSCSLKSFMLHEYIEKGRSLPSIIASCFINEFFGRYYNRLAEVADASIFVSKAQMELVLSKIPSLRDKSHVVYNPLPDIPLIKAERKGIGYFGGKSFVKGFYILIHALKMLKGNNFEAYLTKTSDEPKKLEMTNGIIVNLLPKIDFKNIKNIMRKISIVTIPSLWPEPLPYTLIESMLYGKLIIASNIGGIPEIVDRHLEGVKLVRPEDYVAIAEMLDYFLSLNLEKIDEIGMKNKEYALKRLDNEATLKNFIKILYRVTA
ncbi:MAG: glycosyltransferase family 4 protein [Candidatus Bathyarchaeia archaeon]